MVQIFSMYHFGGQMVDTIDDMSSLTVTNNNKILIAKDDYSVQVKDLLSDKKSSLFSFPTVDKVQRITHCACGNYVATLEGRQTFQKSDRLFVRIYTNWETQFAVNESTKSSKFGKRLLRARIAGVVSPSSGSVDDDYLEMIEIPISFISPAFLTVCQKTGKLLVVCGPTLHLFKKVYVRNSNSKTFFMDFVPFTEVFQLSFHPTSVTMCENVLVAYSSSMLSVFKLKKVSEENGKLYDITDVGFQSNENCIKDKFSQSELTKDSALDVNSILKWVEGNNKDYLSSLIHPSSFPIMVSLKEVNDAFISKTEKRFPFKILETVRNYEYKHGKVMDNLVETLCDRDISVVAESLLALKIHDLEEPITKVALQVLSHHVTEDEKKSDSVNDYLFCVGSEKFIGMNVLVATYQEGYLFYLSSENLKEGPKCVAVFNFMSPAISVMFDASFLHVLTETGLETYTVPSLHSVILHEKPDLTKFSQYISIIGVHPFMGIVDFVGSEDLIIIFTSAGEKRRGRESLPWTVYSLKMPTMFEVYQEMIENSNSFKSRDDEMYKYLSLESFLVLQTALKLRLPLQEEQDRIIRATHSTNSEELAKMYFRSGNKLDIQIGCSVILVSEIDPFKFMDSIGNEKKEVNGIVHLMKNWICNNSCNLSEEKIEWLIKLFYESKEYHSLTLFILSSKHIARSSGHLVIPYLKKYVYSENNSDVQAIFTLTMLCTQECFPKDALEVLMLIKDSKHQKLFMSTALKHWKFLFDEIKNNGKEQLSFSELSSLLIENLPSEMAEILAELTLAEESLKILDIVQMLMKQFPCHVSMQKGHFVLRHFLELIFCSEASTSFDSPEIDNCLKVLVRSYLTELLVESSKDKPILNDYEPIFVLKLPDFVYLLPEVENINYLALRRLQELIWSKKLSEKSVKEVTGTIQDVKLKLNFTALSNSSDFVKDLLDHNFTEAVVPFAKTSFTNLREWKDLVILVQDKIRVSKDAYGYKELLNDIFNYLAETMSPSQLNTILEATMSKTDDLYMKYLVKSQQNSYANDIRELIMNTGHQLLHSNSVY